MDRRVRFSSFVQIVLTVAAPVAGGSVWAADVPAGAIGGVPVPLPESRLLESAVRPGELGNNVVLGTMLEHSLMGNLVLDEIGSSLDGARLEKAVAGSPNWRSQNSANQPGLHDDGRQSIASRVSLARPHVMSLSDGREVGTSADRRTAAANEMLPISREILPLLVSTIPGHASFTLAANRLPNSAAVVGVRPAYLKPAEYR
jgi:hypothetical protein